MKLNLSQLHLMWTLAVLTARRIARRRHSWFFLIVGLLPCLMAFFWILSHIIPGIHTPTKPYGIFLYTQSVYYLSFFLPLMAIFLGLGVISDEIETKNITFTLVRPLNRLTIVGGRLIGHLLAAFGILAICFVGNYFANMFFQVEDLIRKLPNLLNGLFIACFGLLAYLSVIAFFGAVLKRFAILLSIFWIGLDTLFSLIPVDTLKSISIRYRMLSSYWESLPQILPSATAVEPSSALGNALVCLFFGIIACLLMTLRLSREIILSDGSR